MRADTSGVVQVFMGSGALISDCVTISHKRRIMLCPNTNRPIGSCLLTVLSVVLAGQVLDRYRRGRTTYGAARGNSVARFQTCDATHFI